MGKDGFRIWSIWEWEHWRKFGGVYRQVGERKDGNICTDQGLNDILDVYFSGGTQKTSWYVLCFDDNHTPVAGNTYANPGFHEAHITENFRPQWQDGGVSGKQISNVNNKASCTFLWGETIYGGALVGGGVSANSKEDLAGGGKLFCVSQFSDGPIVTAYSDVLKVSVTLSAADS